MSNTLLPCPFCGSENIVTTDFGASTWFVQCDDCGATFPHFDTETEAIAAWNRRAGDDTNVATNADRIRGMSVEEMAEFITLSPEMEFDVCLCCKNGNPYPDDRGICLTKHGHCEAEARCEALKDWLRQPVKED